MVSRSHRLKPTNLKPANMPDTSGYAPLRVARRTRRISWAPSGWLVRSEPTVGYNTDCVTLACPDDFYAIRVGFTNISPTPYAVSKVIAAPSSSISDYVNPTGAAAWKAITFGHNGVDIDRVVASRGVPEAITVWGNEGNPASGSASIPRWTWTDWTPLTSLPRTDSPGAPRLAMIRVLLPPGCRHTRPNGGFMEYHTDPQMNCGFNYVGGHVPLDAVSTPSEIPGFAANLGRSNAPVSCVQFLTHHEGIVGLTTGDSHHQGSSTTTQFWNYLLRATVELGSQHVGHIPFGYWSTARGGADSGLFFPSLTNILSAANPSFVVLPGWTYNEMNGAVHADRMAVDLFFARLLMTAEQCTSNGAIPIFLTPFPRDPGGMTPAQVLPWRSTRNAIMALRERGAIVVDAASILGRTSGVELDGTYLPRYTSDQAHPNNAGHAAIASKLTTVIRELCMVP
jgi:hypothetical protein